LKSYITVGEIEFAHDTMCFYGKLRSTAPSSDKDVIVFLEFKIL